MPARLARLRLAMKPRRLVAALLLSSASSVNVEVSRNRRSSASSAPNAALETHNSFGPRNCVLVERAPSGSCVIKTDCHGQDTSSLEFAFNCWSKTGDIYRHSYGVGGFDEQEAFDTEVKCDQCHVSSSAVEPPPAKPAVLSATAIAARVSPKSLNVTSLAPARATAGAEVSLKSLNVTSLAPARATAGAEVSRKRVMEPEISRYGPKECISAWRNADGHCVVQTACENVDIANYDVGIICEDAQGARKRHTFGRGSFDAVETFDTLALCTRCLGLDDQRLLAQKLQKKQWEHSAEVSEVATLSDEVKTLTEGLSGMLGVLKKLQKKVDAKQVDAKQVSTPPPSVAAVVAAWSGEDSAGGTDNNRTAGDLAANQTHGSPISTPSLRGVPSRVSVLKHSHTMQQVKEVPPRHKAHHHRHHRHKKKKRVTHIKDAQQVLKSPGITSDDIESVSPTLSEFDSMNAEASELEVASAGADSESLSSNVNGFEAGELDDGGSSLDAAW